MISRHPIYYCFQIWEGFVIKPDQMQVVNAACILLFIPLFDRLVYPLFSKLSLNTKSKIICSLFIADKCGMLTRPLQKISTGMFVIASSFIVATVIEILLEKTYPAIPGEAGGTSRLGFHNALPPECELALKVVRHPDGDFGGDTVDIGNIEVAGKQQGAHKFQFGFSPNVHCIYVKGMYYRETA